MEVTKPDYLTNYGLSITFTFRCRETRGPVRSRHEILSALKNQRIETTRRFDLMGALLRT